MMKISPKAVKILRLSKASMTIRPQTVGWMDRQTGLQGCKDASENSAVLKVVVLRWLNQLLATSTEKNNFVNENLYHIGIWTKGRRKLKELFLHHHTRSEHEEMNQDPFSIWILR